MYANLQFHNVNEVFGRIKLALTAKRGLSIARFGNGEAIALAQGTLIPNDRIPYWLEYAGVKLPDEQIKQDLIEAIQNADIVGLTTDKITWDCAPLLSQVLQTYNIRPKYVTDGAINWQLHKLSRFYQTISPYPTALVGRLSGTAAPLLASRGIKLVNTLVLEDFNDLARVEKSLMAGPRFRIALIAAGIPATILCPRLARRTGCIAIDYGHVINDLLKPGFSNKDLPQTTQEWLAGKSSVGAQV
jgi:hypothetical protein